MKSVYENKQIFSICFFCIYDIFSVLACDLILDPVTQYLTLIQHYDFNNILKCFQYEAYEQTPSIKECILLASILFIITDVTDS